MLGKSQHMLGKSQHMLGKSQHMLGKSQHMLGKSQHMLSTGSDILEQPLSHTATETSVRFFSLIGRNHKRNRMRMRFSESRQVKLWLLIVMPRASVGKL